MNLPNLLYFYRRRLRARLVQELLALVGIAVGVALLFAVQISNSSLRASLVDYSDGLLGRSDLQVVGPGGTSLDASVAERIARIDGVEGVGSIVSGPVNLRGPEGEEQVTLIAADEGLVRLGGAFLRPFAGSRLLERKGLVLPRSIAAEIGSPIASEVELQVRGHAVDVPVGAVLGHEEIGPLEGTPVAVAALAYGQHVLGLPGRITYAHVGVAPGRSADVAAALARLDGVRLDVRPAEFDRLLFDQAAVPLDRTTALFSSISGLVGFLFAFNAMLLMARERRAVIAELRLSGYRTAAVVRILAFDALITGIAASALGLALGNLLARTVMPPTPGYLAVAFPVGSGLSVDLGGAVLAVAAGVIAAQLAAFVPLVASLRSASIDGIGDDTLWSPPRRRSPKALFSVPAAAILILGATALSVTDPALALASMGLLMAGMLLTLPLGLRASIAVLHMLRRAVRSSVPTVAAGELRSSGSRSLALTTIAAIAVFGSTSIEAAHSDLLRGLDAAAAEIPGSEGTWITAAGDRNYMGTAPLDPTLAGSLRRLPAVSAVHVDRGGFVDIGMQRAWVIARAGSVDHLFPAGQLVDGAADEVAERMRAGGWVLMSEDLARAQRLTVGDRFLLEAPTALPVRLAGTTNNLGWPGGAIVMSAADHRLAWGSAGVTALRVVLREDAGDPAALLRSALGEDASAVSIQSTDARVRTLETQARDGLARLTQIAAMVLLAAALAMAVAMGAWVWERRRQLADLKLSGLSTGTLWHAHMAESVVLLITGGVVGATYGLYGQVLLADALTSITGFPLEQTLGYPAALVSVGVVTGVAALVAGLPGYAAARAPTSLAFADCPRPNLR